MKFENYLTEETIKSQWEIYQDDFVIRKGAKSLSQLSQKDKQELHDDHLKALAAIGGMLPRHHTKSEMKDIKRGWIRQAKKSGNDGRNILQKFIDYLRLGST